jgi:hypothetical protein
MMVIIDVLPATTKPTTLTALNGFTKVTVVATDEAARLVREAALVAVTRQVPKLVTVSDVPVTTHPSAVPGTAVKVTAPVPEPPAVVRVSGDPRKPVIDETVSAA